MKPETHAFSPSAAAQRDADIVGLLRDGRHDAAFEQVAERYEAKVYRLCLALLRNPAIAQDVAQESLIRVWKALPGYNASAALSTWIYAITRNRCLTALQGGVQPLSLSDEVIEAEAEAVAAMPDDRDTVSTLRRLVAELPEVQRQAITLFYFEERQVAEVADMLACPEGTIKTHLFRARAALQERFAALGLADPALWRA